jgi:serine/threonine protein phosphatase PrpC
MQNETTVRLPTLIEQPELIRAGKIRQDAIRSYTIPNPHAPPDLPRRVADIADCFPGLPRPDAGTFADILTYDAYRRNLTAMVMAAATLPRHAGTLKLPEVTPGNARRYYDYVLRLNTAGDQAFYRFRTYLAWTKGRERAAALGPVRLSAGSLSPYPYNEDAFGWKERPSGNGTVRGLYVVADGMINIAPDLRSRYGDPPSEAAHGLVMELLDRMPATEKDMKRTVGNFHTKLYRDNVKAGRHDPLWRHGTAFTAAAVATDGSGSASVLFAQAADTGATLARADGTLERSGTSLRVPGLPGSGYFLGIEKRYPADGLMTAETTLSPGDTLALWSDGIANIPQDVRADILTDRRTNVWEKEELLLWLSVKPDIGRQVSDESTVIVLQMPGPPAGIPTGI